MRRPLHARLFPTPEQQELFVLHVESACRLYNGWLDQLREAQEAGQPEPSLGKRQGWLAGRRQRRWAKFLLPENIQALLRDAEKAFCAAVHYPQLRCPEHYQCLTLVAGVEVHGKRLHLEGIGEVRYRCPAPVEGPLVKTTVVCRDGKWLATFQRLCLVTPRSRRCYYPFAA